MPKKQDKTTSATLYAVLVIVALIVGLGIGLLAGHSYKSSYQIQSTTTITQTNYSSKYNALQSNYSSLQYNYTKLQNNIANPYIKQIYVNKNIVIPHYVASCPFYNSQYDLYNNYTISGVYNMSLNLPNDGYIIIRITNVSIHDTNTPPPIGTYGIQIYLESLEPYYSTYIKPLVTCTYSTYTGYSCPNIKPTVTGWGLYPANYSATYLAPVSRGIVNISLTNGNSYPINMTFSVTYVGERYSNLTQINVNYSG